MNRHNYYILLVFAVLAVVACQKSENHDALSASTKGESVTKKNLNLVVLAKELSHAVLRSEEILLSIHDERSLAKGRENMNNLNLSIKKIAAQMEQLEIPSDKTKQDIMLDAKKVQDKLDKLVTKREKHAGKLPDKIKKGLYDVNWSFRENWNALQSIFDKYLPS